MAIAALAVGVIQRCLDDSVAYAGSRHAFGRPIGANQGVAFPIADLQVAVDAARQLTYRAAWRRDHGLAFTQEAAVAKLFATEAAVRSANTAIQVHGGSGYVDDYPVERYLRDGKAGWVMGPSNEILRQFVGKASLLGFPSLDYWNQAVNERAIQNELKKMDAPQKRALAERLLQEAGGASGAASAAAAE